jgi:Cysteine-rich secretory protein family
MTLRGRLFLLLTLFFLSLTALLCAQESTSELPEDVSRLLTLTNQDRAAQGLGPLQWSRELAQAAQTHGELLVQHNDLQHQFPGEPDVPTRAGQAGAHFQAIAENIALGPNATDIEKQWMHSAPHRTNILDPQMNIIGIALIHNKGEVWAVEDFAHAVAALGPSEIEDRVIGLLAKQGMESATSTADARQTCEMPHGSAGASKPRFVMRWEGSDLSRLPDVLVGKLHSGQFRSAAVGVCDSAHPGQGFTTYRVAVLLY